MWADDCIEFYLDPDDRAESYFAIQVSAAGVVAARHTAGKSLPPGIQAVAAKSPVGWSVQLAIPLASLGLTSAAAAPGATWGFNVHRNRAGGPQQHVLVLGRP